MKNLIYQKMLSTPQKPYGAVHKLRKAERGEGGQEILTFPYEGRSGTKAPFSYNFTLF